MRSRASTFGPDGAIGVVRDEFSRLRRNLFEMIEAAGMPPRQERAWKGVVRTMTYDAQATVEGAVRMGDNHAGSTAGHT